MSEENVEIIRRGYDAFNRGDWDAALEGAHADIEWRLHGELELDASQTVRGRDALKKFWTDFFDIWDDYKMEPQDFTEAADGRVVVTVRFTALGQGSSVPIELIYFWVYLIRDEAIVAVDLYLKRRDALGAAGLSE